MKKLLFFSFVLFFSCVHMSTAQASGPSFNVDTPAPSSEASPAPSFNAEPQDFPAADTAPVITEVPAMPATAPVFTEAPASPEPAPAVTEAPAASEPAPFMEESKQQCKWVTTSPGSFTVRANPDQPDISAPGAYLIEFKYRYTNRSDDREIVALKEAVVQLTCEMETPSGKVLLTLKAEKPFLKMKKQRGPGSKFSTAYTFIVDEASVQKDESVSWEELNGRIPSDWWKYKVSHSYTVVSKAY